MSTSHTFWKLRDAPSAVAGRSLAIRILPTALRARSGFRPLEEAAAATPIGYRPDESRCILIPPIRGRITPDILRYLGRRLGIQTLLAGQRPCTFDWCNTYAIDMWRSAAHLCASAFFFLMIRRPPRKLQPC